MTTNKKTLIIALLLIAHGFEIIEEHPQYHLPEGPHDRGPMQRGRASEWLTSTSTFVGNVSPSSLWKTR